MDPSIFGTGKVGARFAFVAFIKKPQVILRIFSLLVSIIVFASVASARREHVCIFDEDNAVCSFVVGIGVICFFVTIGFLVTDAIFERISNIKRRQYVIIGDLSFSGFWTFLWFVSFCYMTNKWTNSSNAQPERIGIDLWLKNNARSGIIFSFLSIFISGGITFFALKRFRIGQLGMNDLVADRNGQSTHGMPQASGLEANTAAPYPPSFPGMMDSVSHSGYPPSGYSQPPFTGISQVSGQYYPPTY